MPPLQFRPLWGDAFDPSKDTPALNQALEELYRLLSGQVGSDNIAQGGVSGGNIAPGAVGSGSLDSSVPTKPSSLSVSSDVKTDTGNAFIDISWSQTGTVVVGSWELRWRRTGQTIYTYTRVGTQSFRIEPLLPNVSYEVGVQSISTTGAQSGYAPADQTIVTSLDSVAPAQTTGLSVSAAFHTVTASWAASSAPDLDYYEVQIATNSGFTTGLETRRLTGTVVSFGDRTLSITYFMRVRAVDSSGNAGTYSSTVSATTAAVSAAEIQDAILTTAKFAAGIRPVEIVSVLPTLPSANYPQGSVVTLTTDNKLYRSTGSTWTVAVPTVDLTGQIVDSQIATMTGNKLKDGAAPGTSPTPTLQPGSGYILAKWSATTNNDPVTYEVHISTTTDFTPTSGTNVTETPSLFAFIRKDGAGAALVYGTTYYVKLIAKDLDGSASAGTQASSAMVNVTGGSGGDLAVNTITAANIVAGTITASEIAADTITANNIAANAIGTSELNAGAVTAAKITAGTITTTEIATDTILAGNIAAGAIGADEIAANAVVAGKIAASAVTAGTIAAGAVTTATMTADTINGDRITTGTLTAGKITAGTITTDRMTANTINGDRIAANTLVADKIAAGTLTANVTLSGNIRTADSGARVIVDETGVRLYNALDATPTVNLDVTTGSGIFTGAVAASTLTASGNALLKGSIQTAEDGIRVVIDQTGTIKLYTAGGITYRSKAENAPTNQVSSVTITKPSGTVQNDVMIASITLADLNGGVAVNTATITAPSGWTLIRTDSLVGTGTVAGKVRQSLYYKVAGASEASSYQWSFSVTSFSQGTISSYIGVDTTTPIDTSDGTTSQKSNGPDIGEFSLSGLTTTRDNVQLLGIVSSHIGLETGYANYFPVIAGGTTTATPRTITETTNGDPIDEQLLQGIVSRETITTAGATGTRLAQPFPGINPIYTYSTTQAVHCGALVALLPISTPPKTELTTKGLNILNTTLGGGDGLIALGNATTVPTSNPTGGGLLYAEGGKARWRDSDGVIYNLADSWQTYTPTWGSSGTAPAIVNGTLAGRYRVVGKLLQFYIYVGMGSSTTYGTGNYKFSLPSGMSSANNGLEQSGLMKGYDSSAGTNYIGFWYIPANGTDILVHLAATGAAPIAVTNAAPTSWAVSDNLNFGGTIQIN